MLLRVRNPSFTKLFVGKRVSFQNRLLAYLLYICGAFTLVTAEDDELTRLAEEHGVLEERIVFRHGPKERVGLTDVLDGSLHKEVNECFAKRDSYLQKDVPGLVGRLFRHAWPYRGWTKQPTYRQQHSERLLAQGVPAQPHGSDRRYLLFSSRWLHHKCNADLRPTPGSHCTARSSSATKSCCSNVVVARKYLYLRTSARAAHSQARNGTIGAAFVLQRIVRTKHRATNRTLDADITALSLNEASQNMAKDVASVAAIPSCSAPRP